MKKYVYCILFLGMSLSSYSQEQRQFQNNSLIAITIPEKDLLPENIAYNPLDNSYFVGSTRKGKVIKVYQDGRREDFIKSQQDGLFMVIGMKVDPVNKWLWVCSSGGGNLIGYTLKDEVEGRPAGIFKFDLNSGKLIKKYVLNDTGVVHFFNDLVIDDVGNVYATHMFSDAGIYTIQKGSDQLELFLKPEGLRFPNGLTFTDDKKHLYVAHSDGIGRIAMETKEWTSVETTADINLSRKHSMDGLYFYKNSLIGIQQSLNTVRQFLLNDDGTKIVNSEALEIDHPMMDNPTTGTLVNDEFYYIANAQFDSFNEDGSIFPMEKLYEVIVLKLKLDSGQ